MRRLTNFLIPGIVFVCLFFLQATAFANNLAITNVSLQSRNAALDTATVQFDISWDNSWKDSTNHDAVWIVLKVQKSGGAFFHARLTTTGQDPKDSAPGSNNDLEIYVPSDRMGAFVRRKIIGTGTVQSASMQLTFNYNDATSGYLQAGDTDSIVVKVIGVEMVFIPTATFRAGDATTVAAGPKAAFRQSSSDVDPWFIDSEATISVTAVANSTYYYVSDGSSNEDATGARFTIPSTFPKGYAAFYCMKYELTEGLWVDFINTLLSTQQSNRDITANPTSIGGKNSDTVAYRNTVSFTAGGGTVSGTATTGRPNRALSYLSWMDLCAFLDWAGLRPMTELEYEKVCRGPLSAVAGEYAWGSATAPTVAATITGSAELGLETISTASANVQATNTNLAGGDEFLGTNHEMGPLRVGIFATGSSTRVTSGAGYYGVMEMTGNVWERAITVGNSDGRKFTGAHGDGILISGVGTTYDGNASVSNWPHIDTSNSNRGTTKGGGAGFRGGAWEDTPTASSWVSNRDNATTQIQTRDRNYGGRGVRTYDGS